MGVRSRGLDRRRWQPHRCTGKTRSGRSSATRPSRLKDFMKGLELRVEIAEAEDDDLGRVSQLTFRTNQFNFATIRRSENEIRDLLKRGDATCWRFA